MDYKKLTIEEHKQLGLLLEMTRLYNMDALHSYKTKVKQNKSRENRIMKMIDKLKNELDDQVVEQYNTVKFDIYNKLIHIYYGRNNEAEKKLCKKRS